MYLAKKLRFYFKVSSALIKKNYLVVIVGLLLGAAFYFLVPATIRFFFRIKNTVKIGTVGLYETSEIPNEILNDISYGLTKISDKGETLPALAEKWEIKDDGKTYIFYFKNEDVFWHDGKKFSVKEVNYNFKEISYSASIKDGQNVLIFNLKEPFSAFLSVLSRPLFRQGLIGLGNYKISRMTKTGKFVKSIKLASTDLSFPDKLYRFYNDEVEMKTGFNLGEIDYIDNIFNKDGFFSGKKVKIEPKIMKNAYLAVFFNADKAPFSNKSFRQALAYAIPKESGEKRALGPIRQSSWAYNPDVKPYAFDIEHSRSLLANEKFDNKVKFTISCLPQFSQEANVLKENWQKLNFEIDIKFISSIPEDFDVLLIARESTVDPDQYYFWHSTQNGNISKFKSPRIDKLLEDGRKILSKEERKDIYFDFQRFLVEESPAIFLSHPSVYQISRN